MMGLMVSVGMVVDNSIVVLENIYTQRDQKEWIIRNASLWGSSEVPGSYNGYANNNCCFSAIDINE